MPIFNMYGWMWTLACVSSIRSKSVCVCFYQIFLFGRMSTILQNQGIQRSIKKRDVEEKTELVVEANDKILERVVSVNIAI